MRLVFSRREGFDLNVSLLSVLPLRVCIHSPGDAMLPLADELHINRAQCFWHVSLESFKGIITVLAKIPLDSSSEVLNRVELTVVLVRGETGSTASWI
jgi:hypothetical protein